VGASRYMIQCIPEQTDRFSSGGHCGYMPQCAHRLVAGPFALEFIIGGWGGHCHRRRRRFRCFWLLQKVESQTRAPTTV
jgi:hypothetical protein